MNPIAEALYDQLAPRVLQVLEHFREDFTVHDKKLLSETAVPGIEYLVAVRSTGTQVIVLGLAPSAGSNYLASGASHFLHAKASTTVPVVKSITLAGAQGLLNRPGGVDTVARGGRGEWILEISMSGASLGAANVQLAFNSLRGSAKADVEIALRTGLAPHQQILAETAVHQRVTQLAGTLFWSISALKVDGKERPQWLRGLISPAGVMAEA